MILLSISSLITNLLDIAFLAKPLAHDKITPIFVGLILAISIKNEIIVPLWATLTSEIQICKHDTINKVLLF